MLLWLLVLTGCVYYLLAVAIAFVKPKDEFYMLPGYTLKILKDTKLKQSTNQAITLSGSDLFEVKTGAEYPISSHTYQDGHVKFSLGKQDGKQIALAGRNTWFAWLGAVEVRKGGKPVSVSAPIATAVGSMMLMVPTGRVDAYGADLFKLSWIKNGKEQDWVYVVSGQPGKKAVPREQDYSGSMRPCPSGTYSLGPTEEGHWGEGLGRIWISVYGTDPRQAIGIHVDGNRSYSPGSAGCVTPLTESDMRRVAAWRDAGADTLRVVH